MFASSLESGFVQLCCYFLVAPLRPATAAPSSLEVFLGFCSLEAYPRVLFARSLEGFLGFCSTLLLLSSRPASTGHRRPRQPGGFPRVLFPSSLEAYPQVLFASSLEVSSGFVCKQPGGFPRVSQQPGGFLGFCSPAAWRLILGFCLQAAWRFPRVLFLSSLEDFLGFCFAHPQGSHPS